MRLLRLDLVRFQSRNSLDKHSFTLLSIWYRYSGTQHNSHAISLSRGTTVVLDFPYCLCIHSFTFNYYFFFWFLFDFNPNFPTFESNIRFIYSAVETKKNSHWGSRKTRRCVMSLKPCKNIYQGEKMMISVDWSHMEVSGGASGSSPWLISLAECNSCQLHSETRMLFQS